ncbi:hypothetical protein Pan153_59870 [Gimesia panareensis]|uniref:Uncharacterized protein n=1 Tax=Gimesia panareensis TaxID=2527978 RepID=A0A518FY49_9PLAN|nr:hypothetical protein [Gimesia panareensis]QDV21299.1 hypothetical protein Pan153_59870 [Gimesia panareensis]
MTDGLLRVTKYSLRSLWPLGLGVIGLLVLPPLGIRLLNHFLGRFNPPSAASLGAHFFFMAVSVIMLAVVSGGVLDQTKNLLSWMPVKTAEIVSGLILSTLFVSVSASLVSIFIYRQFFYGEMMFRDGWPVLGPTLFLATLIVTLHFAFWNLQSFSLSRVFFWICFGDAMFFWFMSRYFDSKSSNIFEPWKQVTPLEMITMSVVFVAAWFGAIRSCDRVRCGTTESSRTWEYLQTGVKSLTHQTFVNDRKRFDSISAAFAQLYWQDSCRIIALICMCLGCLVFVMALTTGNRTTPEVISLTTMILFFSGLFLLLMLGTSLSAKESGQMKGYLAIVPLSDRDMALVLTRMTAKMVLVLVGSILLFGLAGGALLSWLFDGTTTIADVLSRRFSSESSWNPVYTYALILLAVWAIVANILALSWSPRRGSKELIASIPTVVIATALINGFNPIVGVVLFLSISALICLATILTYLDAFKTGLLQARALWLAALYCLVIPAVFWNYWSTSEWPLKLLWSSLLILAVTPFASIPLAVSWSRHR